MASSKHFTDCPYSGWNWTRAIQAEASQFQTTVLTGITSTTVSHYLWSLLFWVLVPSWGFVLYQTSSNKRHLPHSPRIKAKRKSCLAFRYVHLEVSIYHPKLCKSSWEAKGRGSSTMFLKCAKNPNGPSQKAILGTACYGLINSEECAPSSHHSLATAAAN